MMLNTPSSAKKTKKLNKKNHMHMSMKCTYANRRNKRSANVQMYAHEEFIRKPSQQNTCKQKARYSKTSSQGQVQTETRGVPLKSTHENLRSENSANIEQDITKHRLRRKDRLEKFKHKPYSKTSSQGQVQT